MSKINTINVVPIGKEVHEGGFRIAYDSLPHNIRIEAREEICRACFWNIGTFMTKKTGHRYFTVFEARELEKFFLAHKLNAWTGKQTK
jgi:hypothetical protein